MYGNKLEITLGQLEQSESETKMDCGHEEQMENTFINTSQIESTK